MKIRVKGTKKPNPARLHWAATGALAAYAVLGGATPSARAEETAGSFGTTHRPGADAASTRELTLTAGPIGTLLEGFQRATGVALTVPNAAVLEIQSPGVTGTYTAEQALRQMLKATGVTFRFTAPNAAILDLRMTDSVVVNGGAAPRSSKYTEALRDVPQTVTIVPSSLIEEQNATTLRDVLRNVTGISIQAGEGGVPAGDNLTVRGFSARTDLFVDGVRDFGGYTRDPFNVEQVEVSKGPSATYTGRGATGGSVNLITKAPQPLAARSASLGAGTSDYKRGSFDVNQPVEGIGIAGTSLRLNAMWTDADTPGRDVASNSRWGLAPTMAFGIGTPTRVTFGYTYLDQDNMPDYGLPWVPPTNKVLVDYRDQPAPVDYSNFYGLVQRDYEKTETGLATVQVERDINSAFHLRNLARQGRTYRDSIITPPRFVSDDSSDIRRTDWKSRDQTDKILSDQLDLTGRFKAGGLEHAVVAGAEVARETSLNYARIETATTLPVTDLYHPNPNDAYTGSIVRSGAKTDGRADSLAAFAFDTVKLSPELEVTAGLRWDRFTVDYDSIDVAGKSTPFGRTDEMLSWRAGAVYKPRANGSVYAAASTSLNPSAEGLALTAATADLEPEKTRSYELGTKWDVAKGRLSVTAALFRTEKSNARTPGVNPGDAPTVLQGELHVAGVDLGLSGRVTNAWRVFGGYTFMDSKIDKSNTPAEVGKEFSNTPRHSFSLWSTYRLRRALEVGGGVSYVGSRFNSNTDVRKAPAYTLLDAMASYDVNSRLTLRLNANNLADTEYIDRVGGGHFIPGNGRLATLNAVVKF